MTISHSDPARNISHYHAIAHLPDVRAHALDNLAKEALAVLQQATFTGPAAGRLRSLLEQMQQGAETLTDDLDPCNLSGAVPPLCPDLLTASGALGEGAANVIPFRR